jgi:hypothetical protein
MRRAVVLNDSGVAVDSVLGALGSAGLEAIAVGSFGEARAQVEAGAVVVVVLATPERWQSEKALPLLAMPGGLRRGCLVVLVGAGLATGDGARAFVLSVDLVVAPGDVAGIGERVASGLQSKRALVARLDGHGAARLGG